MKRLLAYLFIVLGLGLSGNANSQPLIDKFYYVGMTKKEFQKGPKKNFRSCYKIGYHNITDPLMTFGYNCVSRELVSQDRYPQYKTEIIHYVVEAGKNRTAKVYFVFENVTNYEIKKRRKLVGDGTLKLVTMNLNKAKRAADLEYTKVYEEKKMKEAKRLAEERKKETKNREEERLAKKKKEAEEAKRLAEERKKETEDREEERLAKKEKKKSKWITKKTTTEDKTIKSKTNKVLEQEKAKITTDKRDNDAPILIVDENITVNSSSYSFIVKAEDKGSEKIFIQVDGVTSEFKDGIFKIDRFSPVDEKIILVAIDQWGNKSKAKTVNIKVDIKDTIVAKKIEKLNPSKLKVKKSRNKVALIIGIEDYSQSPNATFANLDAKYFYEYASKGFGVKKENIKLMIDKEATLIKSIGVLSKWLPSRIKSGETDLIIFFAGHGLASNDGKDLFLLSQDSDPDLLARTALSRTELFKEIIKLNPKSVTMFLDTCYSGVSRDEKTLLASARPVRIIADEQDTPDNFTIFSASQLDQISSGLKDAKHGIFSYYLMKGLEGKADLNKDRNITNGELLAYMDENVAQKASELGRQQNPSLSGNEDKILLKY